PPAPPPATKPEPPTAVASADTGSIQPPAPIPTPIVLNPGNAGSVPPAVPPAATPAPAQPPAAGKPTPLPTVASIGGGSSTGGGNPPAAAGSDGQVPQQQPQTGHSDTAL